jgi:hypothetical protein
MARAEQIKSLTRKINELNESQKRGPHSTIVASRVRSLRRQRDALVRQQNYR